MSREPPVVYTVGHSTLPLEDFVGVLTRNEITGLADVRSSPYSRFNPQFNREPLNDELRVRSISYVFLGRELGARSDDPSCYAGGQVQYDRLAETELFESGIERIRSATTSLRRCEGGEGHPSKTNLTDDLGQRLIVGHYVPLVAALGQPVDRLRSMGRFSGVSSALSRGSNREESRHET